MVPLTVPKYQYPPRGIQTACARLTTSPSKRLRDAVIRGTAIYRPQANTEIAATWNAANNTAIPNFPAKAYTGGIR